MTFLNFFDIFIKIINKFITESKEFCVFFVRTYKFIFNIMKLSNILEKELNITLSGIQIISHSRTWINHDMIINNLSGKILGDSEVILYVKFLVENNLLE